MTFDEVVEVIAFIVGGLVLVWGFRSFAFALSGGERAGMHELGAPSEAAGGGEAEPEEEPEESAETEAERESRRMRLYQVLNYGLSLAAMAALTAMLIGAWLA